MASVILVFPAPDNEQVDAISPPLSILYLGSFLEKAGVSVTYLDMRAQSIDDFRKELAKGPTLVGVSSMTGYQLIGAIEVLRAVKERDPGIPTVLGGVHASLKAEQSLCDPLVDFVVIGEGEHTLLELTEAIEKRRQDLGKITGLGWKKLGRAVINPPRPFMDLSESEPPITKSSKHLYDNYFHGKVQISRGCPYRCAFCYNTSFNLRKFRVKPLENIEKEIQTIKKHIPALDHFTLLADNIGSDKERIVDIAKLAAKYAFKFHSSMRAEHLDEKLVSAIEGSCASVLIGVESVAPRIRKLIFKDNLVDDIRKAAKMLAGSKMMGYYSFMAGFPGETREETIASMDFADELRRIDKKSVIAPVALCTAFPGTALYERALKEGFKEPKDLEEWRNFKFSEINMPWIDPGNEYFTDLYGMSMLMYTSPDNYNATAFEKEFFSYLQELAKERWHKRDLCFKKEWKLFCAYNLGMKRPKPKPKR